MWTPSFQPLLPFSMETASSRSLLSAPSMVKMALSRRSRRFFSSFSERPVLAMLPPAPTPPQGIGCGCRWLPVWPWRTPPPTGRRRTPPAPGSGARCGAAPAGDSGQHLVARLGVAQLGGEHLHGKAHQIVRSNVKPALPLEYYAGEGLVGCGEDLHNLAVGQLPRQPLFGGNHHLIPRHRAHQIRPGIKTSVSSPSMRAKPKVSLTLTICAL